MSRRADRPRASSRWGVSFAVCVLFAAAAGGVLAETDRGAPSPAEPAPAPPSTRGPVRPLVIESLEITGNTRTATSLALAATGLRAGDPASPEAILEAAERLRESGLFREVEVHTRPGTGPGRVDVVFAVKENRPHLRFGAGYEDLTGWYLIPVQLNMDNLTGGGETFDLSTRFGYRVSGLVLTLRRPIPHAPNTHGEVRLRAEGQERIYFLEGTEVRHSLGRGGIDLRVDHRLSRSFSVESWVSRERVDPDSNVTVYRTNEARGQRQGDPVPWDSLPPQIQDDTYSRRQTRIGLALGLDRRSGTGLGARGIRGRASAEGIFSEEGDFGIGQGDLRAYVPLSAGFQLAARARAGVVSSKAPFYDRFYLGGLYTVRGYPSQSLSPPQGNLNLVAGSIEIRFGLIGPHHDPRLIGLAFLDLGMGGNEGLPDPKEGAAGAGYGLRLRLPWIGRVGLDIGYPLSHAPVEDAFHVNASLGMTF